MLRATPALISVLVATCVATLDNAYEGFPEPGKTVIPIGTHLYRITQFLGSGPKKRAYIAKRSKKAGVPQGQKYTPPADAGILWTEDPLPDEVVVKCSATDQEARKDKLVDEFRSLTFLNRLRSVRKPVGLYLSKQWKCFGDGDFVCQYLVMTKASDDLRKIVSRNSMKLKAPYVPGYHPRREGAEGFSFELFLSTFALSLIAELEKLHAVGLVHRDMSVKNVALDPHDPRLVTLIDMGSSSFLTKYTSISRIERMIKHDFGRVRRVSLQLLSEAIANNYPGDEVNSTMAELFPVINATSSKVELRVSLLRFLEREFPDVRYDGRIVYQ